MKDIFMINRHFNDLNPLTLGWEHCKSGHSFGPAAREYYLLHYVVSGAGVFENCEGSFPVGAGDIFVIRPREITTYTADRSDPWYYIWIGFDGALAALFDALPRPVLPYPANTFLELMDCAKKRGMKEELAASKLFEIVTTVFDTERTDANYETLARDYISANYMRQVRIEDIARQLGVNRQYLSRLFRSAYGMSMQQFLVQTRLRRAAELLKDGKHIAEAAYLVGYGDALNFSKMFKKHYGISPRAYASSFGPGLSREDGRRIY